MKKTPDLNTFDLQALAALVLIVLALPALMIGGWALRATERRHGATGKDGHR